MRRPGACSLVGSDVRPVRTARRHFADAIATTHNQGTKKWVNTGLGNRFRARRIPTCCAARAATSTTWRRAGCCAPSGLRSPTARAPTRWVDGSAPKGVPGVVLALAGDDPAVAGLGTQKPNTPRKRRDGSPAFASPQLALARDTVRYIGEPVAFVVAETLHQAKDAAEAI